MSDLRLTYEQLKAFVDELEALCVKHKVVIWHDYDSTKIRVEPVSNPGFAGVDFEFTARDAGEVKGSQSQ